MPSLFVLVVVSLMVISVSCTPESSHTGELYSCKNMIDSKNGDRDGHFHQNNGGPAHIKLFLKSPAYNSRVNPISEGGGLIQPPPTKYCFKSGYLGARTPQTH